MVTTVLAQKKDMRQVWTEAGQRLVVTKLFAGGNVVVRTIADTEDAHTVQIAFGDKKLKNMNNAQRQQLTKSNIASGKRTFKETTTTETLEAGRILRVEEVFQPGDVLKVTGSSKGKGFAGVVKRWGFKGGPVTHGQSDRTRAPGSIGAGTTPGRVWKNKRMAGHKGLETVTLENVTVVAVNPADQTIWVKGTLPGSFNGVVTLNKQDRTNEIKLNTMSAELLGLAQAESTPVAEVAAEVESTEEKEA